MTQTAEVRDWLGELRSLLEAADVEGAKRHVVEIVKARPDLEQDVYAVAGEWLEDDDVNGLWADAVEVVSAAQAKSKASVEQTVIKPKDDWAAERARLNKGLVALEAKEARREVALASFEVMEQPKKLAAPLLKSKPEPVVPVVLHKPFEIDLPVVNAGAEQVKVLNQKHAVISNYGSKVVVMSWERWEINPSVMVPVFQSFADFKNRYSHRYAAWEDEDGSSERYPVGGYWLKHPNRLTYDGVVFNPEADEVLIGNRLNLWRGFAVEPRRGSWKLMRNHIYRVLGAGDRKAGRYIIRWIAWMLQNLGKPAEAVLVLQGEEGAGKGILARALLRMLGAYGLPVSDQKHLTGGFSGHLQHCVFLFLDEAFWAGNVAGEGRLKSLVTEETIMIEPKYVQPFQVRNLLHIMMSSNNDWVVPAGHGARRYAVFKVSDERVDDGEYFKALGVELDNGGIEAMMWDLLRLNLNGWHPKQLYKTQALLDQKVHSLRGLDAWIDTMLQAGELPGVWPKYPNRAFSDDLLAAALTFDRYTNETVVARKLKKLFKLVSVNRTGARGWAFPPLAECRAAWERRNGGKWEWHTEVLEWAQ